MDDKEHPVEDEAQTPALAGDAQKSAPESQSGDIGPPDTPAEEALPAIQLKTLLPNGIDWIKHTRMIITLVSIVILLVTAGIVMGIYVWDRGLIADGVSLNGVTIGHMSPQAAKEKMEQELKRYLSRAVEFTLENSEKRFLTLAELGYTYELEPALNKAYAIGRTGNIFRKIFDKVKASKGLKLDAAGMWNESTLENALKTAFASLKQAPTDASFRLEGNDIVISPETPGKEMNIKALAAVVKNLKPDDLHPIQAVWTPIQPTITAAQLEKLKPTKLLSTYSTQFNPEQTNRSHNIRLAAESIDNIILKPGEEFSFNEWVGERTVSKGYLEAPVIVGNALVPGIGGGVCQVSTTLYNAVLNAGLTITERHPHALPVTYVPPGRDATVSYGTLDFKFRNTSNGFLRIHSEVNGGTLTFSLYGPPDNES